MNGMITIVMLQDAFNRNDAVDDTADDSSKDDDNKPPVFNRYLAVLHPLLRFHLLANGPQVMCEYLQTGFAPSNVSLSVSLTAVLLLLLLLLLYCLFSYEPPTHLSEHIKSCLLKSIFLFNNMNRK